tara:strand:+ start:518 stop:1468 length:951 start_codon:yes stop_codon:yes gene_type:complete
LQKNYIYAKRFLKRFISTLLFTFIVTSFICIHSQSSLAASGGRIRGGSFRSPTIPRTRNYGGRSGYGGYGGYGRRGIGFPFLLPIFGFGGGGLFGFLILMAVAGIIVNSLRGLTTSTVPIETLSPRPSNNPVSIVQIQIGLLSSAKELQEDLRNLAKSSDTSTQIGLQKILQETTLSLLRQPNLWVYANAETGEVPFHTAESTFNRISITERSKLKAELTTNVSGSKDNLTQNDTQAGEASQSNEFIAATLLIASRKKLNFNQSINGEGLNEILRIAGSITSNDLIALEVIWQPEGKGESLNADELVTNYPNLKHL